MPSCVFFSFKSPALGGSEGSQLRKQEDGLVVPNSLISAFWGGGGVILLIAGGLDGMTSEGPFQPKLSYGSLHPSEVQKPSTVVALLVFTSFHALLPPDTGRDA